jgi:hypothetical protein
MLFPSANLASQPKEWDTTDKIFSKSSLNNDKNDLNAVVDCAFGKNVKRACAAIVSVLSEKTHVGLKEAVIAALVPTTSTPTNEYISGLVINGLKCAFSHLKSITSRLKSAEVMMKNVTAACVFHIVQEQKDVSNLALENLLGVSRHQLALARQHVLDMIQGNKRGLTLVRKQRSDAIRDKVVPYVYHYIKDDEFTRLDTNQGPEDGIEPRTGQSISEHMRIWNEVNKNKRRTNFLESIHYRPVQNGILA